MRIDMHLHTNYSRDSSITYNQLKSKLNNNKKIDYVCITDHDTIKGWPKFRDLNVIKGIERTIIEEDGNKFHLLIYFLNEEIKSQNFYEVMDEVREQDAFCSLAHPYDFVRKAPRNPQMYSNRVDAIETLNSRIIIPFSNKKARELAVKHNLIQTAGSDAHHHSEIGNAYVECECTELEEFRKNLRKGKTMGHSSSPHVHFFSFLSKYNLIK